MKMEWDRGARSCKVTDPERGAVVLYYRKAAIEELNAFHYLFERAIAVYETLEKARASFEAGRAQYENATAQVRHLIESSNEAAKELVEACGKVDQFFISHETFVPSQAFEHRGDQFVEFCREFIAQHLHPKGVLGNSSRARTGTSRAARPKIARSADGSSLTPKEPSCAHASEGTS